MQTKIKILNFFFLLTTSLFFLCCGKEEIADVTNEKILDDIIESEFKRMEMPGIAYVAVKEDSVVFIGGKGYANIKENKLFTPQTRFTVASISKTITLTALMQLYENDLVDLNDDINEYLPFEVRNPNFPDEPITVKMLLTHTSSISDKGFLYSLYTIYDYVDYPESLMSFLQNYLIEGGQYFSDDNYLKEKPGTVFSYSNTGASLIAYIVEFVSGMDFNSYCKEKIFQPLEMQRTTWFFSETPKDEIATAYVGNIPVKPNIFPVYPAGHLISTAEDLSKFLRAFIMNGKYKDFQLLKSQTVDEILQGYYEKGEIFQGLIFHKINAGSFSVWGHNGGDTGVSTEMYFDKENKIAYIVLVNRGGAYSTVIPTALLKYANQ